MRCPTITMIAVLVAALGLSPLAQAQQLVRRFAGSVVLLTNGDTLRGPLTLYSDTDLLVLRQADGTLRTLSPWVVRVFAVKGELTRYDYLLPAPTAPTTPEQVRLERVLLRLIDTTAVRSFISYRVRSRAQERATPRAAPGFYEMLCQGQVSLLRREVLQAQTMAGTGRRRGPVLTPLLPQYELVSRFFLFTPTGELAPLRRPRHDLATLLPTQAPELDNYAQRNKLDYANAYQLRAIVRYANALLTPP